MTKIRRGPAIVAAIIAAAGTLAGFAVFRQAGPGDTRSHTNASPRPTPSGYYVLFPDKPRGYAAPGRAIIDAATNLPNGTIVDLSFFSADMESGTRGSVGDGRIELRVANNLCHETEAGLVGTGIRIDVIVRREYPNRSHGPPIGGSPGRPPSPLPQPESVLAVLGPHFEHLVGSQVRVVNGKRMLQAWKAYELPAATCSSKLAYSGNGSFEQVPLDRQVSVPRRSYPQSPFKSCPDGRDLRPVEFGGARAVNRVALDFDVAITNRDAATMRPLADDSVPSFDGWTSTGLTRPQLWVDVPSGNYIPSVPAGCGLLVALRTWGVTVAREPGDPNPPLVTYLLVLRRDGWKVWGQLPGDGR